MLSYVHFSHCLPSFQNTDALEVGSEKVRLIPHNLAVLNRLVIQLRIST